MHASHELVAAAQGEFDPTPADFQVALAANPMRIDPATCAWGDPFGALCDQIEGRDGSYATQTLSSFHRTDQRQLQLEASGVIISEVRFAITTQPRLRKRLPLRRLIAHPKPVFRTVCGPTEGKRDGAITIRRHGNMRPAERLTRTPGHAMHLAATLSLTIHPTTPVDTTAPMPTQSCQMRHEMRVGETTIRRQDDVPFQGSNSATFSSTALYTS
jgi:hypothetical protein